MHRWRCFVPKALSPESLSPGDQTAHSGPHLTALRPWWLGCERHLLCCFAVGCASPPRSAGPGLCISCRPVRMDRDGTCDIGALIPGTPPPPCKAGALVLKATRPHAWDPKAFAIWSQYPAPIPASYSQSPKYAFSPRPPGPVQALGLPDAWLPFQGATGFLSS